MGRTYRHGVTDGETNMEATGLPTIEVFAQ